MFFLSWISWSKVKHTCALNHKLENLKKKWYSWILIRIKYMANSNQSWNWKLRFCTVFMIQMKNLPDSNQKTWWFKSWIPLTRIMTQFFFLKLTMTQIKKLFESNCRCHIKIRISFIDFITFIQVIFLLMQIIIVGFDSLLSLLASNLHTYINIFVRKKVKRLEGKFYGLGSIYLVVKLKTKYQVFT